jgi:glutathione peroxidase
MPIFELQLPLANGDTLNMETLRGQVLLIVNTASRCGFIRQLAQLAELHEQYHSQGFTLIAAPSNQFSDQEPLDNPTLCEFFQKQYEADFPVLAKQAVQGLEESELYRQLRAQDPRRIRLFPFIPWNFTKLLINREGQLIKRFAPVTAVKHVQKAIVANL